MSDFQPINLPAVILSGDVDGVGTRRSERHPVWIRSIRISMGDGTSFIGAKLLNLSEHGCLIETDAPLASGDRLHVLLGDGQTLAARVAWANDGRAGCRLEGDTGLRAMRKFTLPKF